MANDLETDPEAIPDPTEPKGKQPAAKVSKKKRGPGRPPKQRLTIEVPAEVQQAIAIAPLGIIAWGVHKLTGRVMRYSADAISNTTKAFEAWLSSFNVQLTPGFALLSAYTLALGSGLSGIELDPEHPRVKAALQRMRDEELKRDKAAAEQPAAAAQPEAPHAAHPENGTSAAAAAA